MKNEGTTPAALLLNSDLIQTREDPLGPFSSSVSVSNSFLSLPFRSPPLSWRSTLLFNSTSRWYNIRIFPAFGEPSRSESYVKTLDAPSLLSDQFIRTLPQQSSPTSLVSPRFENVWEIHRERPPSFHAKLSLRISRTQREILQTVSYNIPRSNHCGKRVRKFVCSFNSILIERRSTS